MSKDKRPGGMRHSLTRYGDDDVALFLRKAFIKAMGYSDDALERPIVGIANTSSGTNACHRTVPELIEAVRRGVMLAGGLAVDFPTISLHESFAYPTSMLFRNLMALDTEEMMRAQPSIGAKPLQRRVQRSEVTDREAVKSEETDRLGKQFAQKLA